ncbi:hypothetical protein M409DRAFT_16189 [Zasmidium cellare ATCC 36951]|uniref:Transcription factor TFIIIC triple barrel domain-containing protein n=1 Tax=Zasmidium cellare ATCC 36951 TaxID=1080233 RepID=A0A6A6D3D2_ZASCE|nr:uncharacterized protein M409DRAFT_16189 [Zasmidium cellare ATCC 36951]KAF2173921.1 hypothetical protein M409DRAFT_16189 [Zasmidium cellare ATCC 36951]
MGQPIASDGAPAIVKDDDDDEWEYEYDATETEDWYFTLDLTTHIPDALLQKSAPANGSHESDGAARGLPRNEEKDGEEGAVNEIEDDASAKPVGNLQIIDLHTTNPLIKFDDQIFSCYWSTDLGTQVHIAQAGDIPSPRRAGTVLDVVGTSQTRLIGKPASLKPREDGGRRQEGGAQTNAIEIKDASDSEYELEERSQKSTPAPSTQTPGTLLEIPQELLTSKAVKDQASFLERLSEVKLKKGEHDPIPFHGIRVYDPPDNIEEIRKKDKEFQAAKLQKAKDEQLAAKGDRPRKRRRKFGEQGARSDAGRKGRGAIAASLGFLERNKGGGAAGGQASTAAAEDDGAEEEDAAGEEDDD